MAARKKPAQVIEGDVPPVIAAAMEADAAHKPVEMTEAESQQQADEILRAAQPADLSAPLKTIEGEPDRRRYVGGSDVAALMGVAPEFDGERDTPLTVYFSKIGEGESAMPPDKKLFLNRRKRWEGPIFEMLREEFDAKIVATNKRYVDREHAFLASEIDFEWEDPETGLIENGEVKTVSPFAFKEKFGWGEPGTSDVPIHYYMQVQHGMGVTGARKAILAAMVGLDSIIFYPIPRSEDLIQDMRRVCARFWAEHVLKKVPPDAMSMGDLKVLYKSATAGLMVTADSDVGSKALHLRGMRAQIDALELEAIALEFDVKNAMKDAEFLTVDGRRVWSWKEQDWSRLDQTNLKINEKEIWRKYLLKGRNRIFKAMYGN